MIVILEREMVLTGESTSTRLESGQKTSSGPCPIHSPVSLLGVSPELAYGRRAFFVMNRYQLLDFPQSLVKLLKK